MAAADCVAESDTGRGVAGALASVDDNVTHRRLSGFYRSRSLNPTISKVASTRSDICVVEIQFLQPRLSKHESHQVRSVTFHTADWHGPEVVLQWEGVDLENRVDRESVVDGGTNDPSQMKAGEAHLPQPDFTWTSHQGTRIGTGLSQGIISVIQLVCPRRGDTYYEVNAAWCVVCRREESDLEIATSRRRCTSSEYVQSHA